MKVSILIASCDRPNMFRDMLLSLYATADMHDLELIVVTEQDDVTAGLALDYDVDILEYRKQKQGALSAWNRALQLSTGDILVPAGDDQLFHSHWLDFALESHQEKLHGYGVVGMNDLAYNGNTQVATMLLFDREYCMYEMGGIFAPPMYEYLCVDLEWNEKAKILGKFYWDERSIVEHLHSSHGKRSPDDHDRKKDEGMTLRDMQTFEQRRADGFPVMWDSLI